MHLLPCEWFSRYTQEGFHAFVAVRVVLTVDSRGFSCICCRESGSYGKYKSHPFIILVLSSVSILYSANDYLLPYLFLILQMYIFYSILLKYDISKLDSN